MATPERRTFSVSLVTPEGAAWEGEAQMIIVPGAAWEIGVLARHAPLVAMLKAGSTRVHIGDGKIEEFATGPGFFQVLDDRVDLLREAHAFLAGVLRVLHLLTCLRALLHRRELEAEHRATAAHCLH